MTGTTPGSDLTAKLAGKGPAAKQVPAGLRVSLAPCDAEASGAVDAQVRLAKGGQELNFCGHHYQELEFMLAVAGWRVTCDNRGRL